MTGIRGYDGDFFDAVEFGDIETMELYFSEEIDLNVKDARGRTVLMLAASYGNRDVIHWLLNKGTDVQIADAQGRTALDFAKKDEVATLLKRYQDQSGS